MQDLDEEKLCFSGTQPSLQPKRVKNTLRKMRSQEYDAKEQEEEEEENF